MRVFVRRSSDTKNGTRAKRAETFVSVGAFVGHNDQIRAATLVVRPVADNRVVNFRVTDDDDGGFHGTCLQIFRVLTLLMMSCPTP
jgi:hypothetical protein